MAKTTKKQEPKVVTRAEKKDATKNIIKELLAVAPLKHNELIEETAKIYTARFGGEDTENINDVKGRVGSVLDIMKKESDVIYEGGKYALKARVIVQEPIQEEEKPAKKSRAKAKKTAEEPAEEKQAEKVEKVEKTTKKTAKKSAKKSEKTAEETAAVPEQAKEEKKSEKPAKTGKTKGKKTAEESPVESVVKTEETPAKKPAKKVKKSVENPMAEEEKKTAEKPAETDDKKTAELLENKGIDEVESPVVLEEPATAKEPIQKKSEVMDMSFLIGVKTPKAESEKKVEETDKKEPEIKVEKPAKTMRPEVQEKAPLKVVKTDEKRVKKVVQTLRKAEKKPLSADERLKEAFLRRLRSLGGDYFEYYSVYLLERYSMKNGRRLEGMKISGGERDGGIDGEIELTDKFGFRETIYIQSKNWNPDKGDERLWVVGETLLQQFIGACACRQAQDRKQHCRGIFVTTSRFTPDAKRILENMSDKIVGYDGEDLYEAAKECQFGLLYENGNWKLDEKLLSGTKAFFNMI